MSEKSDHLFELLASLEDPQVIRAFFQDLCTVKEVENMAERLAAATLLMEGKTYSQVMESCRISSATLSRVSRCVQYGEGYRKVIGKQ